LFRYALTIAAASLSSALSLAGALAYEPDGSDAHLFFQLRPGAYTDEALVAFLSELDEVEQRNVLLIWDGLPSPSQPPHERLDHQPTRLAQRGAAVRLCTGPEFYRKTFGRPEIAGASTISGPTRLIRSPILPKAVSTASAPMLGCASPSSATPARACKPALRPQFPEGL
jgi:hypothetical protein